MKIAVGADHRGQKIMDHVIALLEREGHAPVRFDHGREKTCDYPDPAWRVGSVVAGGEADAGILLCGSGVGMCIAANKVRGVRAALVHDEVTAEISRAHIDANVVCLSAELLSVRLIEKIITLFLATGFEGGRHARRIRKIHLIEQGRDPAAPIVEVIRLGERPTERAQDE